MPSLALIGNKSDLQCLRKVSREEGYNLSRQLGCCFYEVSAREGRSQIIRERQSCKIHNMYLALPEVVQRSVTPPTSSTTTNHVHISTLNTRHRSHSFQNLSVDGVDDPGLKPPGSKTSKFLSKLSPLPRRKVQGASAPNSPPAINILSPLISSTLLVERIGVPVVKCPSQVLKVNRRRSSSSDLSDLETLVGEEDHPEGRLHFEAESTSFSEPFVNFLRSKSKQSHRSTSSVIKNGLKRMAKVSSKINP